MKKHILVLVVSLVSFVALNGFGQYKIVGVVKDGNKQIIPSATIQLKFENDSSLIKKTISNENGMFIYNDIKKGYYTIIVSGISFENITKRFLVDSLNVNLGDLILMNEQNHSLKEIKISSKIERVSQKIDRLVINVKGTPIGESGSALEVLERLPGVSIGSDGNSITLNGKSQVGILMNGKLTRVPVSALLQMLNSTNAKSIEKIELISNPPAQYDAEFTGGLINIEQVKNNVDGSTASILFGLGYGKKDKEKIGINWNIRKSKVNFFGDLNYDRNANPRSFNYFSSSVTDSLKHSNYTVTNRFPVITGYTGRLGLDYTLSQKITIGFMANGNMNLFKQNVTGNNTSNLGNSIDLLNNEDSKRSLLSTNVGLDYKIDPSEALNFDVDHLGFSSKAPNYYTNTFLNRYGKIDSVNSFNVIKKTPVSVWTTKIDFSKNINKEIELNIGTKYIHSKLNNTVVTNDLINGEPVKDNALSEISDLTENILAVYSSLDWLLSDKTKINVGVRYEHSTQNLTTLSQPDALNSSVNQFFPSLFLSRALSPTSTLQFSYGRRISRPTYSDLAPYVSFLDPNTYYIGNIRLKPAFSNILSANFLFKKYRVSLETSQEKNTIAQSQPVFLSGYSQQILTSLNLNNLLTSSITFNIPFKVSKFWDIQSNLRFLYINQKLEAKVDNDLFYVLKVTQDFQVKDGYSAQLYTSYSSSRIYGTSKINGFQRVNLSVNKNLKKLNSSIQISLNDVFGRHYNFESINNINKFYKEYDYYEPRVFRLTFTHNLGNSQLKKERKRETGDEEIRNRF